MTGKPDDLVDRLRDRAYAFQAKDPLLEQAANEIERLRSVTKPLPKEKRAEHSLRLTDEEREAIEKAISRELDCDWYGGPEPARVVTLRSLLERMTTPPARPLPPSPTIKPGNLHAREAYKRGAEDEYIDGMQNRYGGEW
jgi:hypothetical protein